MTPKDLSELEEWDALETGRDPAPVFPKLKVGDILEYPDGTKWGRVAGTQERNGTVLVSALHQGLFKADTNTLLKQLRVKR